MTSATLTYHGRLPGVDADAALPAAAAAAAARRRWVRRLRRDRARSTRRWSSRTRPSTPPCSAATCRSPRTAAQPVWAQLPTAVRAFFDNGGRRCYVVRVGEDPRPSRSGRSSTRPWPVPPSSACCRWPTSSPRSPTPRHSYAGSTPCWASTRSPSSPYPTPPTAAGACRRRRPTRSCRPSRRHPSPSTGRTSAAARSPRR